MTIRPGMTIRIDGSDSLWVVQDVNKGKMTLVDFYMGIVELDDIDVKEVYEILEDDSREDFDEMDYEDDD